MADYIKAKNYNDKPLKGEWTVSRKLDGVRAFITKEGVTSRNDKPLYNLDHLAKDEPQDVEVFLGSWEDTVSAVRSHDFDGVIQPDDIYSLYPLDMRLYIISVNNPTHEEIYDYMQKEVDAGHEGIVLRQGDKWFKVKPTDNFDVKVTGLQPGTGKHEGKLGAFLTDMGKVGTGFSDAERAVFMNEVYIGATIEVECMSLTPQGKFRHPRFVRLRFDK